MSEPTVMPAEPTPHLWRRWAWRLSAGLAVIVLLLVGSFELVYAGKVYPGVSADGVSLAGLSKTDAKTHVADATTTYATAILPITYGNTTLHVPLNTLSFKYDTGNATDLAYTYGRTGSLVRRAHEQLRALFDHATNFAAYTYDDSQLTPYVAQITGDVSTPVSDASLSFNDNRAQVTSDSPGRRLDSGALVLALEANFAVTSNSAVVAPIYDLPAAVSAAALTAATPQADIDLAAPLQLTYGQTTQTVTQATIAKWMNVSGSSQGDFMDTHDVRDLYPVWLPPVYRSIKQLLRLTSRGLRPPSTNRPKTLKFQ